MLEKQDVLALSGRESTRQLNMLLQINVNPYLAKTVCPENVICRLCLLHIN